MKYLLLILLLVTSVACNKESNSSAEKTEVAKGNTDGLEIKKEEDCDDEVDLKIEEEVVVDLSKPAKEGCTL